MCANCEPRNRLEVAMRLARIRVENFRSLKDVETDCDGLTVLVGANGVGKSNILKAVRLFQDSGKIERADYYDPDKDITIELVFSDIKDKSDFEQYVHEGEVAIKRVFKLVDGVLQSAYHGRLRQHPEFDDIRSDATAAKQKYNSVAGDYGFPPWTNYTNAKDCIAAWEQKHRDRCEPVDDDGKFFPKKVDTSRFLQTVFIPAVHDATAEADDARNSSLAKLTKEVVRSIEEDPQYAKFKTDTEKEYAGLMKRFRENQLKDLGAAITDELQEIVDGVGVDLSWQDADLAIDLPHTTANLQEAGNLSTVDRSGHGSQRAFIMAILQHLAKRGRAPDKGGERPATILLIEEPELYQHPTRQRLMARVFALLAKNGTMQIMYATHSPHFVGIDLLEHVRLLRKCKERTKHYTEMFHTSLDDMRKRLKELGVKGYHNLEGLLGVIMTPWINEGFFASTIVLVEGQTDYAALVATSKMMGKDLEKLGISVIPCGGKSNTLPLTVMFRLLAIPCYPVWDSDDKAQVDEKRNEEIWRAVGSKNRKHGIANVGACLQGNLEKTLERELGGKQYQKIADEMKEKYHVPSNKNLLARSEIMREILEKAGGESDSVKPLKRVIERVLKYQNVSTACPE